MKELRSPDVSDQVSESLELAPLAYVAGYIALACDEKVSHVHPVNIAAPLETKQKKFSEDVEGSHILFTWRADVFSGALSKVSLICFRSPVLLARRYFISLAQRTAPSTCLAFLIAED